MKRLKYLFFVGMLFFIYLINNGSGFSGVRLGFLDRVLTVRSVSEDPSVFCI
ncbi:hypothetical protein SAMN06295967_1281 [Belliella buryatensis]|uniref:Uncharacterized protein n=1 Tax=Belliella buryatensis TaxID=1500549 RepID=A0A239H7R7_9BACT|nr:hypothetical protein SAMN06295967_1281 [Belliella buryatensis]